jgi:hypothetical protein
VPGINAIRKETISRPKVVPVWSHSSPPPARLKSVLFIRVGGGKKAARKNPASTRTSQTANAISEVARGMVNSREKSRLADEAMILPTLFFSDV